MRYKVCRSIKNINSNEAIIGSNKRITRLGVFIDMPLVLILQLLTHITNSMEKDQTNEFKQFTEEDIEKIFGGSAVQAESTSNSTENQSQSTERMQLQERYTASSDNLT